MSGKPSLVPGAMRRKQSAAMQRRTGTVTQTISNGPGSALRHKNAAARPGHAAIIE
jgi:hypothetical protein